MFFCNVWSNHTDVVVHPSQLFTLSPQPLRLHSSDHLLRCFVHRAPASGPSPFSLGGGGPVSPRLGRLWRFSMYLGADHRSLGRVTPAAAAGGGGGGGGAGGGGAGGDGGEVAGGGPQLLMSAYQTSSACPWARRLISLAGYLAPPGGAPPPLIHLEYRLRVRGIMLPRRMKVQVPVPHSLQHVVHNPLYDMHEPAASGPGSPHGGGGGGLGGVAGAWQPAYFGGGGVPGGGGWSCCTPAAPVPSVRLQNKAPHWNDALMCWCLNFRGRVKMASVKNFQLMACGDGAGRCVMQFGKVDEGIYILDFNPCVLTAAQAFAAALSTFETKYLL
ncbi:hypothetical protein GPECTOR_33g541 [Gonium pectorale]|uniref:Tubby C-terminal domain-containing protein n=1 Tax=Gonium pectorale TaxID=33097 RepID=A0A150GCV3_GONPE|nr:hypothetical protein GPECTOR_33g541 [Gonium pectorale]|eukprot:KXZ47659.1 hypothetical protein GPECTOR_33g541 [Gonium pectorale]